MPPPHSTARPSRSPGSRFFWTNLARYTVALCAVAVGAAAFAVLFRHAIGWFFVHVFHAGDVLSAFQALPWYARVLVPAAGGGLAGLLGALAAKLKGGHGVGDVMEAVALGKGRIALGPTLLKALGSWLAIVSGRLGRSRRAADPLRRRAGRRARALVWSARTPGARLDRGGCRGRFRRRVQHANRRRAVRGRSGNRRDRTRHRATRDHRDADRDGAYPARDRRWPDLRAAQLQDELERRACGVCRARSAGGRGGAVVHAAARQRRSLFCQSHQQPSAACGARRRIGRRHGHRSPRSDGQRLRSHQPALESTLDDRARGRAAICQSIRDHFVRLVRQSRRRVHAFLIFGGSSGRRGRSFGTAHQSAHCQWRGRGVRAGRDGRDDRRHGACAGHGHGARVRALRRLRDRAPATYRNGAIATLLSRRIHRESISTPEELQRKRGRGWQVKVVRRGATQTST